MPVSDGNNSNDRSNSAAAAQPRRRVLAGADGNRLELYFRQLGDESVPEHFANFAGSRSMLDHTFDRASWTIFRQRILAIVSTDHLPLPEVRRQLSRRMVY